MTDKKEEVQNNVFGFGEANTAYAKYFTGDSFLKGLASDPQDGVGVSHVTFAPGTINHWHTHTTVQILIATAGEGWYQEAGKPAQKLLPGDVVIVKPGTKHWHGAAQDKWFSHIAIMCGPSKNEWLEAVNEDDYKKLN